MARGVCRGVQAFSGGVERGAVAGEYPSVLACLALEEEEDCEAAWKGERLPTEEL
jgi:hypothetical protein